MYRCAKVLPAAAWGARLRACNCSAAARSCAKCWRRKSCSSRTGNVAGDVWSATSFTELRRDGIDAERFNLLHPLDKPRKSWLQENLEQRSDRSWRRPTMCACSRTRFGVCAARPRLSGAGH